MVVGNNDIKSHLRCFLNLEHVSDAAVNGDDKADALLVKVLQDRGGQPVPFCLAVGYVGDSLSPENR